MTKEKTVKVLYRLLFVNLSWNSWSILFKYRPFGTIPEAPFSMKPDLVNQVPAAKIIIDMLDQRLVSPCKTGAPKANYYLFL